LPVVQVNVWSGMSLEDKKKIVEGFTRVLEELHIPRESATIIICEEPKETGLQAENSTQRDLQTLDLTLESVLLILKAG
jgi:phenylpyruvate tautomerase PptA (4-oxalocrotonate tautomerase family)